MYATYVLTMGGDPEYFWEKMQFYELQILIDNIELVSKNSWEQTRMLAYIQAQINSKKTLKPEDIMKFTWDGIEVEDVGDGLASEEDKERLEKRIKEMENKMRKVKEI